jgi:uncharacterized protein (DUF2141 family)
MSKFSLLTLILLFTGSICSNASETIPLTLNFEGLKNNTGHIIIAVYKNEADFKNEKPILLKTYSKQNMKNGRLTITLPLPEGTYGIAVLDDENRDKEMNYSMLGMPKEGFGFANYYHSGFSYPKFSNFAFKHQKGNKLPAVVRLRYI